MQFIGLEVRVQGLLAPLAGCLVKAVDDSGRALEEEWSHGEPENRDRVGGPSSGFYNPLMRTQETLSG